MFDVNKYSYDKDLKAWMTSVSKQLNDDALMEEKEGELLDMFEDMYSSSEAAEQVMKKAKNKKRK